MYPTLETTESLLKSEHDFNVWDHPLEKGRHIPLHWHDFFEFELIVTGELQHICNGRECRATAGSAYLMSSQNFHELTALTDSHIYSLHFNKRILPPEILPWIGYHDLHFQFNERETRHLERRFLEMLKESEQKLPFYALSSQSIITEIIITRSEKQQTEAFLRHRSRYSRRSLTLTSTFRNSLRLPSWQDIFPSLRTTSACCLKSR